MLTSVLNAQKVNQIQIEIKNKTNNYTSNVYVVYLFFYFIYFSHRH